MLQLALRVHRYDAVDAEEAIRARTDFFAAAAVVTRAVSFMPPSRFLLHLSARLEWLNMSRAAAIRSGSLYGGGSVAANTDDFIHIEQSAVQRHLDCLKKAAPHRYRTEIASLNSAMRAAGRLPLWAPGVAGIANALRRAQQETDGEMDFAAQPFREAVGRHVSASIRRAEPRRDHHAVPPQSARHRSRPTKVSPSRLQRAQEVGMTL